MKMRLTLFFLVLLLVIPAAAQTTYTATIANGESLSTTVNVRSSCYPAAIKIPSSWTEANLTFQVSLDGGATFGNVRDIYGSEATATVSAATDVIQLPPADWYWVKYFRIRSGTAASAVAQGGERTLTVVCSARN